MLTLTLTADLSGVNELIPDDSAEKNFWYTFKIQCVSCRETHPNFININRFEANDMSGSRGEANFVWKCKFCKKESSASVISAPVAYQAASPPTRQKILEFDCRGLELGEWLAVGTESGTKFTAIDLGDAEWYDYDDKSGEEVSIKDLKWEIRRN
ncbi:hypothetical protein DSL72_007458 [Monilinia vaccinii-corymbosi]|uniref:DUF866 domain protein n=1 Tax=Monilinia vaccinii-corymbosi TaxID=61207 RepID=A0A8A3PLN3_9HELO|nr:hypothetical protein DSL72_007458 [Monilinia vaccinii-corymbosi]